MCNSATRASAGPIRFVAGLAMILAGVGLHVQMYASMASMHFVMAGSPAGLSMWLGRGLIVAGLIAAIGSPVILGGSGRRVPRGTSGPAMEALRLGGAQARLLCVCVVGLTIDVMKPATIAFVLPGMRAEYHITKAHSALFPLAALTGTAVGSLLWGQVADRLGRRAALLIAALGFLATSICGAMPTFDWNVAMCWTMGMCAGGFLPVLMTIITETVPSRLRGFVTVLIAGLGATTGFLAASGLSTLLIPHYSWRIMWLLGVPTGLLLLGLLPFIPESYRYLRLVGRDREAAAVAARLNLTVVPGPSASPARLSGTTALLRGQLGGFTRAVSVYAASWGLINYGLFVWLPSMFRAQGVSAAHEITKLLAEAALVSVPGSIVVAIAYARWRTRNTLLAAAGLTSLGLVALGVTFSRGAGEPVYVAIFVLLIVAVNAMNALLLPYAAEVFPTELRGRGTGLVAGAGKTLGVVGTLAVGLLSSAAGGVTIAALALVAPVCWGAVLIARQGIETRGRPLTDLAGT